MRFILLSFFACFLSFSCTAQEDKIPSKFSYFSFHTRGIIPDFSAFNAEVNGLSYTGIDEELLEYGITAGEQTSKRASSFGVSWVRPGGKGNDPQTQYRHLMVESETTYSFLKKNRTVFGLTLGLAGRWSNLMFVSREEASSASQALAVDFRKFKNFGVPIWAGLDLDVILGKKEGGIRMGLGAGYRFDRVKKWKLEDAATWKTKSIDLSTFYVVARFGLAGRDSFKKDRNIRNTSL